MATFTNQATLSYNGALSASNLVTGEVVEVLSATKTALYEEYEQGGKLTYIVSIVNSGETPFSALTVSDDLGAYAFNTETLYPLRYATDSVRYYVDGVLQAAPAVSVGPPLEFSGISVPADGNALLVYEADVTEYAPLLSGSTVENTVTVSGGGATPFTATETVTLAEGANLSLSKSLSPATVTENGTLTYTFVLQNSGNTEVLSTDSAIISDTFTPALSNLSVSFNSAAWSAPTNYTYDEATGAFATVDGQITVDAATPTQDSATGIWSVTPGVSILTVTGTV